LSGSMYPRQICFIVFVGSFFVRSFLLTVQEVAVQDFRISTSIFTFLVPCADFLEIAVPVLQSCGRARLAGI
jgi:hypothetical protein